ncbi:MAG: DUF4263 domain-containing protein [Thaumarchaeota archaeon]|nr:DUF4263 domain-containing protein [Nitrososphaerota archaeon]
MYPYIIESRSVSSMYYYDMDNYSKFLDDTKELKKKLRPSAEQISNNLEQHFPGIHYHWTRKNTFSYIFSDFKDKPKGRVIGKGESALFAKIKNQIDYVILCEKLDGKFKKTEVDGKKIIQVNIIRFKQLFQKVGNAKKIVDLFLDKSTPDEIEIEAVRELLKDPLKMKEALNIDILSQYFREHTIKNPDEFTKFLDLLVTLSENHEIKNAEDMQKIMSMFLRYTQHYKIEKPEQIESMINAMIDIFEKYDVDKPAHIPKIIEIAVKLLKHHKLESFEELEQLINLTKSSQKSLVESYPLFEKILNDFSAKINSDINEAEIRNFIHANLWILDFKYIGYEKKVKEKKTDAGNIDISLYKDQLGRSSLVIAEFKKPDKEIISTKYRGKNKPVILAEVGKALSQTIHYMETQKKSYQTIDGIVIMGRKKDVKDEFIDIFNNYLHGLKVVTYDDLYENAKKIIAAFKPTTQKETEPEIAKKIASDIGDDLTKIKLHRNVPASDSLQN